MLVLVLYTSSTLDTITIATYVVLLPRLLFSVQNPDTNTN